MKNIRIWTLYSIFLFSFLSVSAQSYRQIYDKIRDCANKGDAQGVSDWINKAIEKSKNDYQKSTDEYYGLVCEKIAIFLGARGKINPKAYEYQAMYLEEAMRVYKANIRNYQNNYIMTGYELGVLYRKLSNYDNAISVFEEILPIVEKSQGKNSDNYINLKYEMVMSYRMKGNYKKAKEYIDEVYAFTEKNHPNDIEMINVLQERGNYYATIGLFELAEQDYRKAIELINNNSKLAEYKQTRMPELVGELGKLYVEMGRYSEAENLMLYELEHKSLPKEPTATERKDYSQLLNSIARLYIKMGRYYDALRLATIATQEIEKAYGKNHVDYYINLETLAEINLLLNIYDKALEKYQECKNGMKNLLGENHIYTGLITNNVGECYRRMGKNLEAKEHFETAKKILENVKFTEHAFYATIVNNVAVSEIELRNYSQAEKMLLQSLTLAEKSLGKNHPDYQIILANLAVIYNLNGKSDKAKEYALQTRNHYLSQIQSIFPTMTEKEKLEFISIAETIFNNFMLIAVRNASKYPEMIGELYNNVLATKGIALNSTVKARQKILNSGDTKLINLYNQWQKTNQMIAKGALMTREEQQSAGINLDSLNTQAQSLSREVAYLSKDLVKETQVNPTWQDIQKKLTDGEAAIEIKKFIDVFQKSMDSSEYAILIITPKSTQPTLVLMKNGFKLENEYFGIYSRNIRNKIQDDESYNNYWKPIAEKLSGVKRVYFSADGIYNKISLYSLYNPATKRYLIEETEIVLMNNTRELLDQKLNKTLQWANNTATIVYNPNFSADVKTELKNGERGNVEPLAGQGNLQEITRYGAKLAILPGTKEEGEKVKQILQSKNVKVQTYENDKATEDALKTQNSPTILHIATHGFFLAMSKANKLVANKVDIDVMANPMLRSGLYLAGATHPQAGKNNRDNGILTAFEIQNMNLDNTELVVLSACETGLGETEQAGTLISLATNSEGVFGLQRAFRIAGAKNIIMSLWKVSDQATNLLMQNFYTELTKTNNIKTAFLNAQNTLRKTPEFSHPYFWAAFVLLE